ncbi:hypothetical protein [Burkholderia multivorans]|uniref:hypothetical protein n=1 Tax=Burkholderia multivorans TaxID=87883 RepID=UPI002019E163|nr:hypothetical protein [Burkholderia multivorans]MCO1366986.1 hypothetical protein [Burkholderia multivorans]MCO1376595.1 hypothetical protein [Burkholderia multivorans]UQP18555.1 hypothetical protein L0Y98_09735 [Burkholderia multivorans]UQP86524.1 hypothetical protein L0Y91_09705 [Burkholderia multivorans]
MEQRVVTMYSDSTLSEARLVVSNAVDGLSRVTEVLKSCDTENASVSRGHLEMISRTLLNGSVDIWYRGRYLTVPLRSLSDWFLDPARIGAANYQVEESTFRRWMDCEHEHGVGNTFVTCNHEGCRQRRMLTFYDPTEMQQMERRAALEIWYCHHHRAIAWDAFRSLGDGHMTLLKRIYRSPGCNRVQLEGDKRDTDFLASIGLLISVVPTAGKRRTCSFHLTQQGMDVVRALSGA